MSDSTDRVGIDISTMEAIQSLFGDRADPWALDCLANWIDVTVNHREPLFAMPKALGKDERDVVFPPILKKAHHDGLINPVGKASAADRIMLSPEDLQRLYIAFDVWASANHEILVAWLEFTSNVRRIVAGRFIDEGPLNRLIRDEFWFSRPGGWLRDNASAHQISTDSQQLAFDMVVRAAQYHIAFSTQGVYQPHPLRNLYVPYQPKKVAVSFSWGWLLIGEIARGKKTWDTKRLLGAVQELRDLVREKNATARDLLADAEDIRREKLNALAVKMDVSILPPSFEKWAHGISVAIGGSLEVIGHLNDIPYVGLAWHIVDVPLRTGVMSGIEHLKCVQRRVDLPTSSRPSLEAVQRNLR